MVKRFECSVQIYVEIERARLTRRLAGIWEEEGKIDEAADTLQEVAVVRPCFQSNTGFRVLKFCLCVMPP